MKSHVGRAVMRRVLGATAFVGSAALSLASPAFAQASGVFSDVAGAPRQSGATRSENSNGGTYVYNDLPTAGCPKGPCTGSFSNKSYADLSTGKIGAVTFATERNAPSGTYSQWWDQAQFGFADGVTSREIDFSFAIDGTVARDPTYTSGYNYANFVFYIEAFAIRDPNSGVLSDYRGAVGGSAYVFNPVTVATPFQTTGCASTVSIVAGCHYGPTIGKLTSFTAGGLAGSFTAKAGETYRITAGLGTHGTADFYNTAMFRFASLGAGTTMQSASGVFLSNVGAVPEPTTWAMMIGGFGLVGATIRRRRPVASYA